MREVAIQCTIGPSCNDPEILAAMMDAGMVGVRVNLSHGSAASQEDKLVNFRRAVRMTGTDEAAIMFDLRGPEIRVKEIPGGSTFAGTGETLVLRCEGAEEEEPVQPAEHDPYGNEWGSYVNQIIRINYEDLCGSRPTPVQWRTAAAPTRKRSR
jgi:Pyruvate kinase